MVLCCESAHICRPCLNPKCPLRRQLLSAFLTLAALSLLLALGVVLGTSVYTGYVAQAEVRRGLEEQIERHIMDASAEAATTIGERFRRIQYGVVDMTSYAYRDAMQEEAARPNVAQAQLEDLELADGTTGYPLSPAHTDLRDTELLSSSNNLQSWERYQDHQQIDLTRSVWYYANGTSYEATVNAGDRDEIARSARLDLLWPTAYVNSNDTKTVYVAVELPSTNHQAFRRFPGLAVSSEPDSLFACDGVELDGECYDPSERPWYKDASEAEVSDDTYLGAASVTDPYLNAIGSEKEWMVTLARAVYSDSGSASSPSLLGVVGADVRLEQLQLSIERVSFLQSGYSMLVTANDGVVIAAPSQFWDRNKEDNYTTVCELGIGICEEGEWEAFIQNAEDDVYHFKSPEDEEDNLLLAAPVNGAFGDEGEGRVKFYILSVVPQSEIFEPAEGMSDLIRTSTIRILIVTGIVAAITLAVVAVAVCCLSGAITRPIMRMTAAADSISRDGAKTNVFGNAAKSWTGKEFGSGGTSALQYLLCSGDDEIKLLGREFAQMISGLGKRGLAARATELEGSMVYPLNPFTAQGRPGSLAPPVPSPNRGGAPRA